MWYERNGEGKIDDRNKRLRINYKIFIRKRYHRYNILIIIVIPKKDIILGMIEKIKITNLNININNNTNNKWIKIRKDVYKDRKGVNIW